jgi:heat-inducible transcriptional repressor
VLRALISQYVRSGEPVGSKTLVDKFGLGVSSATVRNELSALEEAGLIQQPHTSAGRVPTDAGYRYFVDRWGGGVRLPERESRQVRQFFGEPRWELEEALRQTASLLSQLTDTAALVFVPAVERSVIRHVELVALAGGRAMVVVVTDTGRVYNHAIARGEDLADEDLHRVGGLLNALVVDKPLEEAAATIKSNVERFVDTEREVVTTVVQTLQEEIVRQDAEKVFLEGTSNIIDEHKFADLETVRHVIEALEHRRLLLEVLADALSVGHVSVRIGAENSLEEMQQCSVVMAPYGAEDHPLGSLGVVGPTRMDYRRTIAAVHEVAANLGRMLSGI